MARTKDEDLAKRRIENVGVEHCSERTKRYKEALDSSADELVCPLTLELPVEPVTAEDGKVYERTAIEAHFANKGLDLKSPVTNEPMGRRLFPALQVRNVIEKLVASGAIGGDKAIRWNEELEKRRELAALRKKAEDGDADAMCSLGVLHNHGDGVLVEQDATLAYTWYKKAADCGHDDGTANAGLLLIQGRGVARNIPLGMMLLGRAEEAGSNSAAYFLGVYLCEGCRGLQPEPVEGKRLLRKVLQRTKKDDFLHEEATELLRKLDVPAMTTP